MRYLTRGTASRAFRRRGALALSGAAILGVSPGDIIPPAINSEAFDDAALILTADITEASGAVDLVWTTSDPAASPAWDGSTWSGATYEAGRVENVSVGAISQSFVITNATPDGARKLTVYAEDAAGNFALVGAYAVTVDNTAPVPSGVTVTPGDGQLAVDWSADSAEGNARIIVVADGQPVPTDGQIMAGTDAADAAALADTGLLSVISVGSQPQEVLTGLTNGVTYDVYLAHRDARLNIGSVTVGDQTPAAPSGSVTYSEDFSGAGYVTTVNGLAVNQGAGTFVHDNARVDNALAAASVGAVQIDSGAGDYTDCIFRVKVDDPSVETRMTIAVEANPTSFMTDGLHGYIEITDDAGTVFEQVAVSDGSLGSGDNQPVFEDSYVRTLTSVNPAATCWQYRSDARWSRGNHFIHDLTVETT